MDTPGLLISLSAAGAIKSAPGKLIGIIVCASGGNAVVEITDDTDGSGSAVITVYALQNSSAQFTPCKPASFLKGIYAKTVTNAVVSAVYE